MLRYSTGLRPYRMEFKVCEWTTKPDTLIEQSLLAAKFGKVSSSPIGYRIHTIFSQRGELPFAYMNTVYVIPYI